jgi:hypothetical protein
VSNPANAERLLQNCVLSHLLWLAALIRIQLTAPSHAIHGVFTATLRFPIRVLLRNRRNIALPDSEPPP